MPYSDERVLLALLQTPGLRREDLVQIVITETSKNKPLRTTLATFMALSANRRMIKDRDDALAMCQDDGMRTAGSSDSY
jgi:hypothetical protein